MKVPAEACSKQDPKGQRSNIPACQKLTLLCAYQPAFLLPFTGSDVEKVHAQRPWSNLIHLLLRGWSLNPMWVLADCLPSPTVTGQLQHCSECTAGPAAPQGWHSMETLSRHGQQPYSTRTLKFTQILALSNQFPFSSTKLSDLVGLASLY